MTRPLPNILVATKHVPIIDMINVVIGFVTAEMMSCSSGADELFVGLKNIIRCKLVHTKNARFCNTHNQDI